MATAAEAQAGTDATRAVSPATAKAAVKNWIGYTPANKAGDTFTGPVAIQTDPTMATIYLFGSGTASGYGIVAVGNSLTDTQNWCFGSDGTGKFRIYHGSDGNRFERINVSAVNFSYSGQTVWPAGNDGAGSGLDADLLDGRQATDLASVTRINGDQMITLDGGGILFDRANKRFLFVNNGVTVAVIDATGNLRLAGSVVPNTNP
jgi:hypothetical protein